MDRLTKKLASLELVRLCERDGFEKATRKTLGWTVFRRAEGGLFRLFVLPDQGFDLISMLAWNDGTSPPAPELMDFADDASCLSAEQGYATLEALGAPKSSVSFLPDACEPSDEFLKSIEDTEGGEKLRALFGLSGLPLARSMVDWDVLAAVGIQPPQTERERIQMELASTLEKYFNECVRTAEASLRKHGNVGAASRRKVL